MYNGLQLIATVGAKFHVCDWFNGSKCPNIAKFWSIFLIPGWKNEE
jgi:hypothetical protein